MYLIQIMVDVKMAQDIDNFDVIRDALHQYGGRQKPAGDWRMIQCPFPDHNDGGPSCGVYMRRDGRAKLGFFNCLGCGKKGGWNTLAGVANLPTIQEWNNAEKSVGEVISKADEESLLGDQSLTVRRVLKIMKCEEAQPWPENIPWRGFKGNLLRLVGGLIINDYYNDSIAALFPVRIAGKVRGAVKAVYEKKTKEQLGYITMSGEWVNSYGLFPFEFTKKLIDKYHYNFVILVEGPRDALRLLKLGIPALAVLGANTIGRTKALYISSLGVDTYYVMPDNDMGGTKLWKNLKEALGRKKCNVKQLKLPKEKGEDGKVIKMDPFNAPREVISNLKTLLRERHGWANEDIYAIQTRKVGV
jgi:5S rRNA maturation endonuclease (ribonuclease M5)